MGDGKVTQIPLKCSTPGCTSCGGPIYMHSRCHPGVPTWTKMDGDIITVECVECKRPVAKFVGVMVPLDYKG